MNKIFTRKKKEREMYTVWTMCVFSPGLKKEAGEVCGSARACCSSNGQKQSRGRLVGGKQS
jgi:hypothetical protein